MGKNFKEFWKRQIAKCLAVAMTLSTLFPAGIPVVHAEDAPLQEVDGRIISELAMQKIAEGGSWTNSFEFTAEILNEIFGTTIATLDSDPTKRIDLAKDINQYTTAEENVIAALDDTIDTGTAVPITIQGNNKKLALRIMMSCLPTQADNPIDNYSPVIINGKQYSDLVAGYLGVEGALINRDGVMNIGLGNYGSAASFNGRFDNDATVSYVTPPTTGRYLGKSFSLVATNGGYSISNLPYLGTHQYEALDSTPTLMIVPRSPFPVTKTAYLQIKFDDGSLGAQVAGQIQYTTADGEAYNPASGGTTKKVTARATLPAGYQWASGEDGVAQFGYWDSTQYIYITPAEYVANFTVVDKYDSTITLSNAILTLQQKVGGAWVDVGDLPAWAFDDTLQNALRAAAGTSNYTFRVINRVAQPGYELDTDVVSVDPRTNQNLSKNFQETAKHIVHISNVADDGTPMAGAQYTLTYGEHTETLTLDAAGNATSAVFLDSGLGTLTLVRNNEVPGYIADGSTQTRTLALDNMTYSAADDAFAYTFRDQDTLFIPDYNHSIEINVVDETNTAVGNVELGIYTDAGCTTPAKTETGVDITPAQLTSNTSGKLTLPEVPAGTYYIKLVRSTAGYSDVLFTPATSTDTSVFTVVVEDNDDTAKLDIGIRRQVGDITLTVTDENGNPVVGAIYELEVVNVAPDYNGVTLSAGNIIANYTTDDNGVIHITQMNRGPLSSRNLLNGSYKLNFVSAPYGYKLSSNAPLSVALNWQEHTTIVYATITDTVNNVTYQTNFSVVDKYDSAKTLDDAVLSLQQKVGENWQHIGDLPSWQLTPSLINTIRAAATTFNFEFQVINRVAQPGYTLDDSTVAIDARYDNNRAKQFQEVAKHIVHITNVADDGTPMAGAKYTLTYGDFSEEIVLDANGHGSSSIFLQDGATSLTLTRDTSVGDYVPEAGNQTRTLTLSDMAYNTTDDAFAYTFTDEDAKPDYNHHINIHVIDETDTDVGGIQLGLYTDANCTNLAVTELGAAILDAELTTDALGNIALPEVPAGTYYIKLVRSTTGYSDTLFDTDTDADTTVFTVTVIDDFRSADIEIGIRRQVGDITLTVTDENGNPVVGAEYELTIIEANPDNYAGVEMPDNTVVGRYTTDDAGIINITTMNSGALTGKKLINGSYELSFASSPYGYNDSNNAPFAIDLGWVEGEDVVSKAVRDTINNVTYQTNFTVVDKNDTAKALNDAVLSLEQKVDGNWQHVGDLSSWQLTPAMINTIRAAATTVNYEFRIINRVAQPGYALDETFVTLDARYDSNLTKEFQEAARYIVRIENFAEDTTPMAGAKYTLTYGSLTEELTIGADGKAQSSLFLGTNANSLTLVRDTTVGDYVPQPENQTRTLALTEMVYNAADNAFVYTFTDTDANPDYNHYINIHVIDETGANVENVRMGIFTDAEFTIPAKTEAGLDITDVILTTNAAGMIELPEVPVGTYYIKLVRSTEGYSDTLFNPETDEDTLGFAVAVVDDFNAVTLEVGIRRQIGDVTLTVHDENDAPVVGATYALKLNGTVVGEYTTDDNGIIHITHMNKGAMADEILTNGQYVLDFVSAPANYKVSEGAPFDVDLGWEEHANVIYLEMTDIIETYVTYTLNIDIKDAELDNNMLYSRYAASDDDAFKAAYENSLLTNVAYLVKGKNITLTVENIDPIEVLIDGALVEIPAGTTLLTHNIDGGLEFSFANFYYQPVGADAPIAIDIPQASYKFTMSASGTGYEWVAQDLTVDAYDNNNRTLNVTFREQIVQTRVKFTKTDANYGTPIANISFALVNLDVLTTHGLDVNNTNLDNKDLTEFLADKAIDPVYIAISNTNGVVDFGMIPYGSYMLIELYDQHSADYEIAKPIIVNATGGTIDESVTNTTTASFIRVKYMDKESNAAIAGAQFSLLVNNSVEASYDTDSNGAFISNHDYINGSFIVRNTNNVGGYMIPADVEISVVNGTWKMGDTTLTRVWDSEAGKWIVEIPVYATKNTVNIYSKYDGALLPGTTITIVDADNNVIDTINNATGAVTVRGLAVGKYLIKQSTLPGFVTQNEVVLNIDNDTASYDVTFNNQKTLVTVKTLDAIGGWELDGVVVEMYDDDKLIATFNDTNKSIEGIPAGAYILKTVQMPTGYQAPSADITITVVDTAAEQVFITNIINPDETPEDGSVVYEDNRTYGTLSLIKKDSFDNNALANVEFTLTYAEDTIVDGNTIPAGTVIAVLKTDAEGKATLDTPVAIGAYTEEGITPIVYALTETKLPVGQYVAGDASIDLGQITFDYVDDKTPLVTIPEIEIGNNRPNIIVSATSDPETRLFDKNGVVTGYEHLTVLQNGQEVTYTITVENNGNATGYDIDVRDILPAEFVITNASTGTFSVKNGVVYWHISEIAAGETVKLVLKAKVDVDGAALLDNNISWTMPETPYAPGEQVDLEDESIKWNDLPTSQYQVIMFRSAASQDRIIMSAFDTLTLHYNFSAMDELTDFSFTDVIPEGLTYVEGSAKLNGEVYEDVVFDEETRTLTFLAPDTWMNNMRFTFTLQVDYIQVGSEHEWETHANVTFLENAYTMKELTLYTDTITIIADALMDVEYYTDIETFIGDKDNAEDVSVLKENDYVIYSAYIYNNGVSKLKNVMLKDILPEGMTFEPVEDNDKRTALYADDNEIVWFAASINPGEAMEFSVKGTVKDQKAALIDNHVTYDVMKENVVNANGQMVKLLEFQNTARDTDSALFQVLEFHKAAEVVGKPNDNGKVAIGDTLVYTMSITAADIVNGIEITDKVPAGVTFVPGSAQIKLAGQNDWVNLKDAAVYDKTSKTVKFDVNPADNEMITIAEGVSYFRFSVTVDRIGTNNANANNYNKATFTNAASLDYWALPFDEDSVETLESEAVTHMTEISVTGEKSGSIDTFEGKYADRKYVTVVAEGDELVFKISVKNSGANALTNVVVEDTVPANSTLVGKDGDTYTNKDGVLTWIIPEIKANETAEVSFTVKVTPPADKAVEIINQAKYAVPMDINNIKASEWIQTNSVVYQAILIKMSSSVPGGVDATDAKTVEIGSTITYTITVENVDDIYGLNLSNKIPEGMEFVPDSAKVKIGDGTAEAAKFTLDGNTIKFNQFDEVKAGKMEVSFAVKVKDTTDYDKAVVFINQADVTLKPTKDAEKDLVMKTNPISHTTKKTNATDTPKLGLETTSASLVWGLITMVALAGIGVFGYFGFIEPKKRRK